MSDKHGYMKALKCRECGREYPLEATHVCEFDFGPLEVAYDYDRIKKSLTRAAIESRPKTMWRYRELLPVASEPTVGKQVGFTPLIKADRLAKALGIRELYIKNDAVELSDSIVQEKVGNVACEPLEGTRLWKPSRAPPPATSRTPLPRGGGAGLKSLRFSFRRI